MANAPIRDRHLLAEADDQRLNHKDRPGPVECRERLCAFAVPLVQTELVTHVFAEFADCIQFRTPPHLCRRPSNASSLFFSDSSIESKPDRTGLRHESMELRTAHSLGVSSGRITHWNHSVIIHIDEATPVSVLVRAIPDLRSSD